MLAKWHETLRALIHRHKMEKVAHWCDKECSIIIVEYKCTDCNHEAWDFVYFDDSRCKVLKRIPVEVSALNAPKLAQCGEPICEQVNGDKKIKAAIKRQRRSTDFGGHVESKTKATGDKEKRSKQAT